MSGLTVVQETTEVTIVDASPTLTVTDTLTSRLTVAELSQALTIQQPVNVVRVTSQGQRGDTGPAGPQGPPGSSSVRFGQDFTAANPVVVNHGLGFYPHVSVIVAGEGVDVDVVYGSLNQVTITFSGPQTGRVELS